jgi:glyoxylase I family protein
MGTTGLSHLNLRAPRELLDALKDFYCEVVGLRNGPRPPFRAFGYWLYAGSQAVVHLSEAEPGEARGTDVSGTFDHVAFDCTNRGEVESLLDRRGVSYRMARVPQSNQVQLFLKDPAGNGVELNFAETGIA